MDLERAVVLDVVTVERVDAVDLERVPVDVVGLGRVAVVDLK